MCRIIPPRALLSMVYISYMGSKKTLAPLIIEAMETAWGPLSSLNLWEPFAGIGGFTDLAATRFASVSVNDSQEYSRVFLQARANAGAPYVLGDAQPLVGYFTRTYSPHNGNARMYFTPDNAQIIDGWLARVRRGDLSAEQANHLLARVICGADKVANKAVSYGAYLKHFQPRALKTLALPTLEPFAGQVTVRRGDARDHAALAPPEAVVYVDPPYTAGQYSRHYHILEALATPGEPAVRGVSGLSEVPYTCSPWCRKREVLAEFRAFVGVLRARKVVMSYSTDGLMAHQEIRKTFKEHGYDVKVLSAPTKRMCTGQKGRLKKIVWELVFVCTKKDLC